jgi:hypothetical protein
MKTTLILMFFIFFAIPISVAIAGSNSINYNGTDITIGMKQDVAISKLTNTYDLTKLDGDENSSHWLVKTKGQNATTYGSISIVDPKIWTV